MLALNLDLLDHRRHVYGGRGRPFPGKHYESRPDEALVLPSYSCVAEGSYENTLYPSSVEDTCVWLTERPFKTMQRAMHLAFPDTTRWWLDEAEPISDPEAVANHPLWRTYLWRFHPDEYQKTWWRNVPNSKSGVDTLPAPPNSMVFVVQPPWILALQDMRNLANCTSVSTLTLSYFSALTVVPCSCHHYQITMFLQRVNSTAPTEYGRICSIHANIMIVTRLYSRLIMGGCLARSRKTGHQLVSASRKILMQETQG